MCDCARQWTPNNRQNRENNELIQRKTPWYMLLFIPWAKSHFISINYSNIYTKIAISILHWRDRTLRCDVDTIDYYFIFLFYQTTAQICVFSAASNSGSCCNYCSIHCSCYPWMSCSRSYVQVFFCLFSVFLFSSE